MLDLRDHGLDDSLLSDKMLRREYRDLLQLLDEVVCEVLDARDTIESISEEFKPDDGFARTRPYLEDVSLHEEHPWLPVGGRASELYHDEFTDEIFHHIILTRLESETLCLVLIDLTDTIDT